ncbi:PREDICTED: receptor-type tyrosine-protein phosphatase beta-like [Branchiostoma belcheri]|uniref:Receptor-type tyrosine-protein phosphatase beta-like n=1 Tax=Branchiostoma belcheri TaxID=7741 RepID=A0A6P4XUR4_BRABE|nr:PREDICTED: receptor-type tyrosine-protein phosphatase beta-like [Branchiostoma belcheri]
MAAVRTLGSCLLLFQILALQVVSQTTPPGSTPGVALPPGVISISPSEVSENSIRITWTAAAGAKDSYSISISPDTGVTNPTGSVNAGAPLEYTFTGLTAGTLYTIAVVTVSGGANSIPRTTTQRTTVAQPGEIIIPSFDVTETSIRITWAAAVGTVYIYDIGISPTAGVTNPTGSVNAGATLEYTFTGLTAGTLYTIAVVTDSGGDKSVAREETQRTTVAQPGAISILPAEVTENSIRITWAAAAGAKDSYGISISPDTGVTNPTGIVNYGDTQEYTFTGLTAGTLYIVAVVTDSGGDKSVTREATQRTTVAQPGAFSILPAGVTENSIRITWSSADGAKDRYSISISPADGANPTGSVNVGATLEFTFTGLTAGTEYTISVVTVSGGVNSVPRTTTQRTTVAQTGAIIIVMVTVNRIKITWAAAAGAVDSYDISISPTDGVTNPTGSVNAGATLQYTFTGLTAGTLYTISVVTDSGGVKSMALEATQRTTVAQSGAISILPAEVTENSIRITWTAAAGAVDSYDISISPTDGVTNPTGSVNAGAALEYTFTGLTAGTMYTIRVVTDSGGNKSVPREATQRTNVAQPGAISTASNEVTENSIRITWAAAAGAVDSYDISISPDTGVTNPTGSVNAGATLEYTFTGLTAGTLYTISVITDSGGDKSVAREATQRTTVALPGAISTASNEVTENSIRITWTAAAGAVDSYDISISPDTGVTNPTGSVNAGATVEYTFTGLTAGTLYTISVVTEPNLTSFDHTAVAQPGAISILPAEVTENSIRITWAAAAGAKDSYDITISPDTGITNPPGSVNAGDTLEYTFNGLTAGTLYTIAVLTDSGGVKSMAREETQRTTVAQSGAISILPAEVTENSIRITWAAAAGAKDSYDISISPDTGVTNPTGSVNDGNPREYTFTGLTAGTLYTIRVVTVSGGVNSMARTAQQRTSNITTVAQPGDLTIASSDVTENSIKITWSSAAGAADSYSISISPAHGDNPSGSVIASAALEYTFTGLTAGTEYIIIAVTVSGGVNSVARTTTQRTTVAQPGVISIAPSDVSENSMKITWTAAVGAKDSYIIIISPDSGVTNPTGSVNNGDTLEYTFAGLTAGTLYTINVITVSGGVNSVARTKQQRTTVAQPGVISIVPSDVTENSIRITWTAAAGAKDSYSIDISPTGSVNDGDMLEYSFNSLTAGTLYTISVTTVSGGESSVARVKEQRTNATTTSAEGTATFPPTTVTGSPYSSTSSPDTSFGSPACGAESGVYAGIAVGTLVAGVVIGVLATLLVQYMRAKRASSQETEVYEDVVTRPAPTRQSTSASKYGEREYDIPMETVPPRPQEESPYQELKPAVYEHLRKH